MDQDDNQGALYQAKSLNASSIPVKPESRANINSKFFSREYMTISDAHRYSKQYMTSQSKVMLEQRDSIWKWQYGFLIFAMIMMYPTPLMN
jgi:hypothetical protein